MLSSDAATIWFDEAHQHIERVLLGALSQSYSPARQLHEAMQYALMGGGKRIRPLLVFAASELSGRSYQSIAGVDACALAVEAFHTYSLVHDDLPSMDNDDLRRGRPTVHKVYDEAMGLLVGDSLQTLAFEVIANSELSSEKKVAVVQSLSQAGGLFGMAGGQAIDLENVGVFLNQEALTQMHRMKTGALLRSCARIGAIAGGLTHEDQCRLDLYASSLGLLFQVVDDVLDATQDSQTLGKTAGKDAAAHKPTFVSLLGLDDARQFAQDLHQDCLESLTIWGENAGLLKSLADRVLYRSR